MSEITGISHDTAAGLLGISPKELAALVNDGHIRRSDKNSYALVSLVQDWGKYNRSISDRIENCPTQAEAADHLDLTDRSVRELETRLDLKNGYTLSEIRIAYIRHLRAQAAGHQSEDGLDLVKERVLTERVDRELKLLQVAEKKGVLVNVEQLEPELANMVAAFRAELLARDDKLKSALDALYGTDIDLAILNDHTYSALHHLARYDAGGVGAAASSGAIAGTA